MVPELSTIVLSLLKMGGPWVMVSVFLVLYWLERKSKEQLSEKLFNLALEQVKKDMEVLQILEQVRRDVDAIRRG